MTMNGMPGFREEAYWAGMSMPSLAYVAKVRVIDQRIHVDCYDPETGQQWLRLPLMVLGGSPGSYLSVPPASFDSTDKQQPEEGMGAQVLIVPRHKQTPIALGCVQHPASGYEDAARGQQQSEEQGQQPTGDDKDHPLPTTPKEHIWTHAGVRLQLTSDGSLVIDTQQSEKPVRIQLAKDSVLRISRGGAAGGKLALWDELEPHLDAIKRHQDYVVDYLDALADIQASLVTQTLASGSIASFPGDAKSTAAAGTPTADRSPPDVPKMGAAAIDISKDVAT